jgi:hypothetical protein
MRSCGSAYAPPHKGIARLGEAVIMDTRNDVTLHSSSHEVNLALPTIMLSSYTYHKLDFLAFISVFLRASSLSSAFAKSIAFSFQ